MLSDLASLPSDLGKPTLRSWLTYSQIWASLRSESHAYTYVSDSFTIQPSLSMGGRLHGCNVTSTRQSLVVDFEHHRVLGFGCSLQACCVLRLHDMPFAFWCKSRLGKLLATAWANHCKSPSCKLVKYLLQFWVTRLSSILQEGSVVGLFQMPWHVSVGSQILLATWATFGLRVLTLWS